MQGAGQVERETKSWLPSLTWFFPLLGPLVAIVIVLISGPCILNLLFKCVSSRLEPIQIQMVIGKATHTGDTLLVPWPLSSPQRKPWLTVWGPHITPCQLEAVRGDWSPFSWQKSGLSMVGWRGVRGANGRSNFVLDKGDRKASLKANMWGAGLYQDNEMQRSFS
jgi:hypothetical protein